MRKKEILQAVLVLVLSLLIGLATWAFIEYVILQESPPALPDTEVQVPDPDMPADPVVEVSSDIVIAATPSVGPAPLDVQFAVLSPSLPASDIEKYEWRFGDEFEGQSAVTQTVPAHTYVFPGQYWAEVFITTKDGRTYASSVSITALRPGENPPPETAP